VALSLFNCVAFAMISAALSLRPVCLSDAKKIRLPSGENQASMSFHSPLVI
jgi:hypothetical protein